MIDRALKESFFKIVVHGNKDHWHIKLLYDYCYKVALASIWAKTKYKNIDFRKFGITPEQLAHDSIEPLFVLNNEGMINIQHSYENWGKNISDESDIDFFLHRIIWKSLEQRIVNLQKESDPVFAKILKTISIGISKYNYKKVNHFGTVYIISGSYEEIDGPVISPQEFKQIPAPLFLTKQRELIDGLFLYIQQNKEYFPALPLYLLVKRIKDLYVGDNIKTGSYNEFKLIEISDIISGVKNNIVEKIQKSYVEKGKLNKDEAKKIINIFNDISHDLINGGMNINIMNYFETEFKGTSKEEYYSKYQKILSYLYNIFREEISANLK